MEDTTSTTTTDTSNAASTAAVETTVPAQATETARPTFDSEIEKLKAQDEAASTTGEPATTAQETPTDKTVKGEDKPASKKGPIPFDAHEKALTNARTKAVEEAKPQIEQEIRKSYAWAEAIEPADRDELQALYRGLKTDLIGTLTTLIDNASQHPDHVKTLRSQAARLLSAARRVQGDAASDDDEPQPDIPLEDGRAVYSADQLATRDRWRERRLMAQFDQKLQPFQQDRENAIAHSRKAEAWQRADSLLKTMREKPHFTEHEQDIAALMDSHPEWSLEAAYNEVLITKVLPTASQRERTAVLADIHHKAGAGTLNPQTTTTATQFKPDGKFTDERVRQWFESAGA